MAEQEQIARFIDELEGVEPGLIREIGTDLSPSAAKNQRQLLFRVSLLVVRALVFVLENVLGGLYRSSSDVLSSSTVRVNNRKRMTWGEFKAHVERECCGLTDDTPVEYIDVGALTFLRKHAGTIDARISARGELYVR